MTKLKRLGAPGIVLQQLIQVEMLKHLEGDLVILPRPSSTGTRRAEIRGRAKSDRSLEFRFEIGT